MALEAIKTETTPMNVQTVRVLRPSTALAALTETAMAIRMRAIRSLMTPPNGLTETVTTAAITPAGTTPMPSLMTPANGKTATAMATAITPVDSTAITSQPIQHSGAMKTAMATAITPMEPTATCARLSTASRRSLSAEDVPILTLMV